MISSLPILARQRYPACVAGHGRPQPGRRSHCKKGV